ncbi:unnamed protein product [Protopolystoma xenopodis]|uniref:Uncharacterized protein n=1 Tax=Protopolystoma xenopodis TaxID=117903 RepID=A0A3S5A7E5_9PLAT|nr:unnamed protein product [Protopolystoma xenopodis]
MSIREIYKVQQFETQLALATAKRAADSLSQLSDGSNMISKYPTPGQPCSTCLKWTGHLTDFQKLVDISLDRFAADRIALADFALESAGASIVGTRCTRTYTEGAAVLKFLGIPLAFISRSPSLHY